MIFNELINILKVPANKAEAFADYLQTTHSLDLANTGFFELKNIEVRISVPDENNEVNVHATSFPKSVKSFAEYEQSEAKKQVGEKFMKDTEDFHPQKVFRGFFKSSIKD